VYYTLCSQNVDRGETARDLAGPGATEQIF
jgi:hypothetical protein